MGFVVNGPVGGWVEQIWGIITDSALWVLVRQLLDPRNHIVSYGRNHVLVSGRVKKIIVEGWEGGVKDVLTYCIYYVLEF